jgi:predicted RND superfamily exporter protein
MLLQQVEISMDFSNLMETQVQIMLKENQIMGVQMLQVQIQQYLVQLIKVLVPLMCLDLLIFVILMVKKH